MKSTLILIHFTDIIRRTFRGQTTNWIKKGILLISLCHAVKKIISEFTKCLQFQFIAAVENFTSIAWIFMKKWTFFKKIFRFFPSISFFWKQKNFYSNCTKFSENIKKYIEIYVLKFKANTTKIQWDINIFSK